MTRPLSSSLRRAFVISTWCLTSCSGGGGGTPGGGGGIQTAANVVYTIPGPYSQAYTPAGGTAFTATQVKLTYIGFPGMPSGQPYESLRVDITFNQDISTALPPPGTMLNSGNQLGVYIGLDVDDNETTGLAAVGCENTSGQSKTGDEFFVDAGTYYGRLADGNYSLVHATQTMGSGGDGEVATSVAGSVLTEVIDLGTLGNYTSIPKVGVFTSEINGSDVAYAGTQPFGQCAPSLSEFVTGS